MEKEDGRNASPELVTDSVTGFLFAMRVSELEMSKRSDVEFTTDEQGEMGTLRARQSKTDQMGQGIYRKIRQSGGNLFPLYWHEKWTGLLDGEINRTTCYSYRNSDRAWASQ